MTDTTSREDLLVSTDWVADRLAEFTDDNSDLRLLEVDVDTTSYEDGHIPGATGWNWETDLSDNTRRDVASKKDFQNLLRESGVDNDTTIVLYGDNHNWFATWAAWQLDYYGFDDVKLVDGGRGKWLDEGRDVTNDTTSFSEGNVELNAPDNGIRAFSNYVQRNLDRDDLELVDVRSAEEFTGEKIAPEGMNETAQRGGHIPGATNIQWKQAIRDDGTFKSEERLREVYESEGITDDKEIIAYCRIGERSSHTWFVLNKLLGYDNVRNYDGSWTEWGNLVGAPIAKGRE
jgi:thiosulfate/3-mercaptopyruvate sulfurtransferase